jgi:uncharacterized protein YqgQ
MLLSGDDLGGVDGILILILSNCGDSIDIVTKEITRLYRKDLFGN